MIFFYCYGDPRYLHSFPTRRSSTLLGAAGRGRGGRAVAAAVEDVVLRDAPAGAGAGDAADVDALGRGGARSEEHTSELQSRQYLVCRLLLEKKKNQHIANSVVPCPR